MKITAFIKSLLPSLERDQILEDLRLTKGQLSEMCIPCYKEASHFFKGRKFRSTVVQRYANIFERDIEGHRGMMIGICEGLEGLIKNLDQTEDLIKKVFNEEMATAGLTYQKANILMFVENSSFVAKYARRFLLYVYAAETADFEESTLQVEDAMTPAERRWVEDNFLNFINAFGGVTHTKKGIAEVISEIPDINVTDDNEEQLIQVQGVKKIDPMNMRLIPVFLNPLYHIGMHFAEYQHARYKAAEEERKALSLRLMYLEKLASGKKDPHLEQEIRHTEGRIQDLNYKLEKMESKK